MKKARKTKEVKRLYWSISEVSEVTGVKAHVLRYWETEFPSLSPKKNSSGKRHYRERDIELILAIRKLLHEEGYTIKGARHRLASTRKVRDLVDQLEIPFGRANQRQLLKELREGLLDLRKELEIGS
ncbi:MAG: MerR family transcriptional regulator [Candidatus Krumholzibacteria bacterium]|jgi:DNA-binding transcriptional MerR regulator|nr:MerR family transcriptional regulator [Candidatus Krumholzibacteria bacterium]MDP6669552.1 MerR family transcriptional regulator [Candidatus Krumholzibacteria bacterium]MDP6797772.1 MerR family transcriptional regulator [Candidatus Krumholzibacteria bacterium]MDP7020888.1 MerR family transcriptional regulator [Candidatus Krumholzibacteria bacterium]